MNIMAVFFDVDGVLIDNLEQHLQICRDLNDEYGLKLSIPDADQFKEMVRKCVKVSPMEDFFVAVGFKAKFAKKADQTYKNRFAQDYPQTLFDGVPTMLKGLKKAGFKLGIVTANVKNIIESVLGDNMQYFNPECCFTKDSSKKLSKPEALKAGANILGIQPDNIIYVGDQKKDFEAAEEAGTNFLGVTYGWGIAAHGNDFQVVDSCSAVTESIIKMVHYHD